MVEDNANNDRGDHARRERQVAVARFESIEAAYGGYGGYGAEPKRKRRLPFALTLLPTLPRERRFLAATRRDAT